MNSFEDEIKISLNRNEALVLFEFLTRFSDNNKLTIEDQAEEQLLWDLCCVFEKILDEPFSEDYLEILKQARKKVRNKTE